MYFLPFDANARLCGADRGAGAFGGEGLVEYGVGLAAVDDVDAGDALLDGLDAAVDLGNHAAGDGALVFERLDVLNVEVADDVAHLDVVAQALDVGEDDELFRAERAGELARGGVAVDVVGVALPVGADGGDDGDEARVEHGVDGVGVDVVDVADEAELLAALVAVIDVAAHAGEADGLAADLVDPADQLGVDLTDEEKADLKETLEKYKTKIEAGAMTVNDAATDYALKVQQDSTYQTGIKDENGMQSSYMPDAFVSAIKEMNEGDVEVVESTKYMIVLHRLPIKDDEAVDAFEYLARTEGIICAIESAHAVAHVMKIAPQMEKDDIIIVCLSGRGDKDVAAIARYRGVDLVE